MQGLYKGKFITSNTSYDVQYSSSKTASRVDFIRYRMTDGFTTFGEDSVHVASSTYEKAKTYSYGDYQLYLSYRNLMTTVHYYYFKGEEILKDKETEYSEVGIVQTTHYLSKDKNLEHYQVIENGVVKQVFYRCGQQAIELYHERANVKVDKLSKLDYAEIVYDDEEDFQVSSTTTYRSLNEIATFKDLSWLETKQDKYFILDTEEDFERMMVEWERAWKQGYAIAVDTETTGLNFNRFGIHHPGNDQLVGICISHKEGYGWYIPVGHISIPNLDIDYVLNRLKPLLEQANIVTHYGKFDWMVFHAYGIDLNIVDDTFIGLYITSNIDSQQNLKLKHATETILGFDQIELSDIFPGGDGNHVKFQILPRDLVWAYAPTDADTTISIYAKIKDKIPRLSKSLYKHEVYFMKVLARMEYYGNKVDMQNMLIESDRCAQNMEVLKQEIYRMVGYTFNLNSPPALSKLLYEDLKCEVLTKTPQGTPSTGATALMNLSKKSLDVPNTHYKDIESSYTKPNGKKDVLVKAKVLNTAKYPVLHVIQKYKKLVKLHTTFFAGMKRDTQGGWIFSFYNQTRAATGRTISNFQQIPSSLKHLIIPFSDEYYMVNLDYKSIELFVMVGVSGEEDVIKQFSDPEADAHRIIGSQLLKKPPQEISGKERKDMKVANFGVPFDMGPHSLAQFLRGFPVTRENVEYAKTLKADYLNAMPKVKRMFTETRDKACRDGIVTTKFGRVGVFSNLVKETDDALIARGRRQAGNLVIQGTAADILKIATNRLSNAFNKHGIDAYITGTIHDELILVVNKKHHPYQIIKLVKDNMELKIKGFPPIFTGIAISNNWGEGHGMEILEIPQYLAMEMVKKAERGEYTDFGESYRDGILTEIREYLMGRFRDYFVELGLDLNDIDSANYYNLVTEFKHMYLGPRCQAYYTDFGGNSGEPELVDAIKLALRDVTGLPLEEIERRYLRDIPDGVFVGLEDVSIDFDMDEFLDEAYASDFEEGEEEVELEHIEKIEPKIVESQREDVTRILITYDSVLITLDGCNEGQLKALNSYFLENHLDNGMLAIRYYLHGELIDTPMRVDTVDRDYLMRIIQNKPQELLSS